MLTEQTISILRKAVARAKEIPEGFTMAYWASPKEDVACGTAGCLAFEICAVTGSDPTKLSQCFNIPDLAIERLGLTENAPYPRIFHTDYWPSDFLEAYYKTRPYSLERVLVLEQAVERWIAGDGNFND